MWKNQIASVAMPRRIFRCSPDVPLKDLPLWLRREKTDLLLMRGGKVQGLIHDYRALVDEHAFYDSPFSIGQLLNNAVRASLLVDGSESVIKAARRGTKKWIELLTVSRKLIGWLAVPEKFDDWFLARSGPLEILRQESKSAEAA